MKRNIVALFLCLTFLVFSGCASSTDKNSKNKKEAKKEKSNANNVAYKGAMLVLVSGYYALSTIFSDDSKPEPKNPEEKPVEDNKGVFLNYFN